MGRFHTVVQSFRIGLVLFFLFFILAGCGTIPPQRKKETLIHSDSFARRINEFLEEESYARAIPLIKQGNMDALYEKALNGLRNQWVQSLEKKDWKKSLAYRKSLSALGEEKDVSVVSEDNLILKGIRQYIDEKKTGAAMALVSLIKNLDSIEKKEQLDLAAMFGESGHKSTEAELLGLKYSEKTKIERLVNGTVTVWVDRGLRLVRGVGFLDRGIGSGFFIDSNGYILTNYHVIESEVNPEYQGYSRLYIKLDNPSGERIPAKVVGWDITNDLALLKTEIDAPYVFHFSKEPVPALGERINAIGSPGGLMKTLTSGTVSAYARTIQPMLGSLQIDVPINPGNSGGPLLNSQGEVIGVVFAGVEEFEGVNFAIPSQYARMRLPELYNGGKAELPWIGVSTWDNAEKITITYVIPDSPAAEAGLKEGDIIHSFNGNEFKTIRAAQEYIIAQEKNSLFNMEIERSGKKQSLIVFFGTRPDIPLKIAMHRDARENLLPPLFGFFPERISGYGIQQKYRIQSVLPGSIADEAGFTVGDTIHLKRWKYFEEVESVVIQVLFQGKKAAFTESALQMAVPLNLSTVL